MERFLPSPFCPAELARTRQSGRLSIPVSHFKRFAALLANDSGDVSAEARFAIAEGGEILAEGNLRTKVFITCQRCMGPAQIEIDCGFKFAFVEDEKIVLALEDEYDPVVLDGQKEIEAVDFLEDELILQLPARLVHTDETKCDPTTLDAVKTAEGGVTAKTHNPFSGLDELLKK